MGLLRKSWLSVGPATSTLGHLLLASSGLLGLGDVTAVLFSRLLVTDDKSAKDAECQPSEPKKAKPPRGGLLGSVVPEDLTRSRRVIRTMITECRIGDAIVKAGFDIGIQRPDRGGSRHACGGEEPVVGPGLTSGFVVVCWCTCA